jgi:uncharacterized protein (DUF433 family)
VVRRFLATVSFDHYVFDMKTADRVELGQYIVADPKICHGQVTFKGTRVFVADVLSDVERGLSWDFIVERWGRGKISKAAIAEAVHLARHALLDENGRLSLTKAA